MWMTVHKGRYVGSAWGNQSPGGYRKSLKGFELVWVAPCRFDCKRIHSDPSEPGKVDKVQSFDSYRQTQVWPWMQSTQWYGCKAAVDHHRGPIRKTKLSELASRRLRCIEQLIRDWRITQPIKANHASGMRNPTHEGDLIGDVQLTRGGQHGAGRGSYNKRGGLTTPWKVQARCDPLLDPVAA